MQYSRPDLEAFYWDFRQQILLEVEYSGQFKRSAFMEAVTDHMKEAGHISGFSHCHWRSRKAKWHADGFYFTDDDMLDIHVADHMDSLMLKTLGRDTAKRELRKLRRLFLDCSKAPLFRDLEETAPEYRLARGIFERKGQLRRVNFYVESERTLEGHRVSLQNDKLEGVQTAHHVWDIGRLYLNSNTLEPPESVEVDFSKEYKPALPCLQAFKGPGTFPAYLAFIKGDQLAKLYDDFGARLLDKNVRRFLQTRGNINRGIQKTIHEEPHMFFSYNNGITATAKTVGKRDGPSGGEITSVSGLQIVNGGQTTASLHHASLQGGGPDLSQVLVQMKITVIGDKSRRRYVEKISEYANTQNRITGADLRSNDPVFRALEMHSRRMWAPPVEGKFSGTKWFFERSRGQYLDKQANMTREEKKRFKMKSPANQKFTKTDLAKFEHVWDGKPHWVNLGAEKNFVQYAERLRKAWGESNDQFNERYFHRVVARAIVFRATERLVSSQSWYDKAYRANIVAYTLAGASALARRRNLELDYQRVWHDQGLNEAFKNQLARIARLAYDALNDPDRPVHNISEWAKKEDLWAHLEPRLLSLDRMLSAGFWSYFVPVGAREGKLADAGR